MLTDRLYACVCIRAGGLAHDGMDECGLCCGTIYKPRPVIPCMGDVVFGEHRASLDSVRVCDIPRLAINGFLEVMRSSHVSIDEVRHECAIRHCIERLRCVGRASG